MLEGPVTLLKLGAELGGCNATLLLLLWAARLQMLATFHLKLWLSLPVLLLLVFVALRQEANGWVAFLLGVKMLLQTFAELMAHILLRQQRLASVRPFLDVFSNKPSLWGSPSSYLIAWAAGLQTLTGQI